MYVFTCKVIQNLHLLGKLLGEVRSKIHVPLSFIVVKIHNQ